jgi:hypothetical protein
VTLKTVVERGFERSPSPALARELRDQREQLVSTLTTIMCSRSHQDAIAERSYWHPNGFAKFVLDSKPRAGEVRLHVWPQHPHDEDVHGHAWAYESIVLAGELAEIAYREAEPNNGQAMWRHWYRRVGRRQFAFGGSSLVHLRAVSGPQLHAVGDRSGGSYDHIHRFFASKTPAATLVCVGPLVTPSSTVYRLTAEPPPITTPRPTTSEDVRQWIEHVAQAVAT